MTKPSCYKQYSSITKDVILRNCPNCAHESACKYLSPRDNHGDDDRISILDELAGIGPRPPCISDFSLNESIYEERKCSHCLMKTDCIGTTPTLGLEVQADARSYQEGGAHYKQMGVQPWDVIDSWEDDARIGFFQGNALKYLMRMGIKEGQDPVLEIKKARHYCDKLIEVLESKA